MLAEVLRRYQREEPIDDGFWRETCSLSAPASPEEIESAWPGRALPEDLVELWSVSAKSRLFWEETYGGGFVLLNPAEAAAETASNLDLYPEKFRSDDIVVGDFVGMEICYLVMAPSEPGPRSLQVTELLDERADWWPVGPELADFLDRFRVEKGRRFWEVRGQ